MKNVYEVFFFLKYKGGWSFIEAYNLPIQLREWFGKRLMQQIEDEHEAHKKAVNKSKRKSTQTRRG
jgi:hypothetical protein